MQVKDDYDIYKTWGKGKTADKLTQNVEGVRLLHDNIENNQKLRNLSYLGAGAGLASLSLSIALPIIVSKK